MSHMTFRKTPGLCICRNMNRNLDVGWVWWDRADSRRHPGLLQISNPPSFTIGHCDFRGHEVEADAPLRPKCMQSKDVSVIFNAKEKQKYFHTNQMDPNVSYDLPTFLSAYLAPLSSRVPAFSQNASDGPLPAQGHRPVIAASPQLPCLVLCSCLVCKTQSEPQNPNSPDPEDRASLSLEPNSRTAQKIVKNMH